MLTFYFFLNKSDVNIVLLIKCQEICKLFKKNKQTAA